MQVRPVKTRIFRERENLADFIEEHIPRLADGSVLVVTSKIVALAEGRTAAYGGEDAKEKLVRSESDWAVRTKHVWLTRKDGNVLAGAGIDESNGDGRFILLPEDCYASAAKLRDELLKRWGVKNLGVILTDSRTIPLRKGIVGVSLGYAGLRGIRDYEGTPDIFGRLFHFSKVSVVDSLAAAAVLVMGEGSEQQPLAVIEGAPVDFKDAVDRGELAIDPEDDMYRPFFDALQEGR